MSVRPAVAALVLLLTLPGTRAVAQADVHARAVARATCQSGQQSQAVTQAAAALEGDPEELGLRMRLADALVDQGCYQEAVGVLEDGQEGHPRNRELAAKLRDVRSLVTEQTYIEGLTQAAEAAKFQRNQLRCTRLADLAACEDALKIKPEDQQLLAAKQEATKARLAAAQAQGAAQTQGAAQGQEPMRAQTTGPTLQAGVATRRAPPTESATGTAARHAPSPESASRLAARRAPSDESATHLAADDAARPSTSKRTPARPAGLPVETPATVASLEPPPRSYSNEAPPGQTN